MRSKRIGWRGRSGGEWSESEGRGRDGERGRWTGLRGWEGESERGEGEGEEGERRMVFGDATGWLVAS